MARVFRQYEQRKADAGYVDFEDLLGLAIRLFDEDPHALAAVRERFRAFTVDEYQDVNLLQQTLLDRWLGGGDELCAVGDDYQSIYAFTGATPDHLLALPRRFPHAAGVRRCSGAKPRGGSCASSASATSRRSRRRSAGWPRTPAGSSIHRTSSVSASSCAKPTSGASSSSRGSSTTGRRRRATSWPSSN